MTAAAPATVVTAEQAMEVLFEKRAIVRFYESSDTAATTPTIRITLVGSNLEDRYTVIRPVTEGPTQDLILATQQVLAEYEAGEAVLARRAALRIA